MNEPWRFRPDVVVVSSEKNKLLEELHRRPLLSSRDGSRLGQV